MSSCKVSREATAKCLQARISQGSALNIVNSEAIPAAPRPDDWVLWQGLLRAGEKPQKTFSDDLT